MKVLQENSTGITIGLLFSAFVMVLAMALDLSIIYPALLIATLGFAAKMLLPWSNS